MLKNKKELNTTTILAGIEVITRELADAIYIARLHEPMSYETKRKIRSKLKQAQKAIKLGKRCLEKIAYSWDCIEEEIPDLVRIPAEQVMNLVPQTSLVNQEELICVSCGDVLCPSCDDYCPTCDTEGEESVTPQNCKSCGNATATNYNGNCSPCNEDLLLKFPLVPKGKCSKCRRLMVLDYQGACVNCMDHGS